MTAQIIRLAEYRRIHLDDGRELVIAAGRWRGYPYSCLPPECPVTPVNRFGDISQFVDAEGRTREIWNRQWGRGIIVSLFSGDIDYLRWAWPRWSRHKSPRLVGWNPDDAYACLIAAASRRALFNDLEL